MKPVRELIDKFRQSDGRIKVASALGVLALAVAIAIFGVIPAFAGNGLPSTAGVQPTEIELGGGSGGCAFIGSTYTEYHINNPTSGTYTLPGTMGTVTLSITGGDTMFSYSFSQANVAAFQLTVNGGQKSLKYDNAASLAGPRNADGKIHAPTKGNSTDNLFKLSHINFCYGIAYPVSGIAYEDANINGSFDSGETKEKGVTIAFFEVGGQNKTYKTETNSQSGNYEFRLPPGSYTICEGARDGWVQTEPSSGAGCNTTYYEALGRSITVVASPITNQNFGRAEDLCGQDLSASGSGFTATIEIFDEGNSERTCFGKIGALYVDEGTVNFPVAGNPSGSFAAYAVITKNSSPPPVPLQYNQGPLDTDPTPNGFEDVPWCDLRVKGSGDGTQFDTYLPGGMYPSLDGVTDPESGVASTACLVYVEENAEGTQTNVLLIQGDPQFR